MRRVPLSLLACVVLFGALLSPVSSKAGAERHPLIRRAQSALQSARTDLQNAAHDYCGHRVAALEATNTALSQLHQALACDARNDRSAGEEIDTEPSSEAGGERHPNINRAISALSSAEGDLQNAAHDYCGHRVEALGAIRAALTQLRLAIECDNNR